MHNMIVLVITHGVQGQSTINTNMWRVKGELSDIIIDAVNIP